VSVHIFSLLCNPFWFQIKIALQCFSCFLLFFPQRGQSNVIEVLYSYTKSSKFSKLYSITLNSYFVLMVLVVLSKIIKSSDMRKYDFKKEDS